jgi:hypothetical protein
MTAEQPERVYRFEPLDASGIFLGLGVLQCLFLGLGLVASVLALTLRVPLAAAALPVSAGAGLSFGRVRGRTAWEWVPLLVSWAWMRVSRGQRWFARLPLLPEVDGQAPALPPPLRDLAIVEVPWRGALHLGAVADRERGTLTAVVPVAGPEFVVQPRSDQEYLLGGWADVLNQFAVERGVVTHIAWSDFTRPSGLHEHRGWLTSLPRETLHPEAEASYGELLSAATAVAASHETLLTLTVSRDRLPRRMTALTADPDHALARALCASVEGLLRAIRSAGLSTEDPLDSAGIARMVRTRLDPPVVGSVGGRLADRLGLVAPCGAGPVALETRWRHLRVDGSWHRTFWVACWPRLPVGPAWLEPFLSGGGAARTMTVIYCPVSTYRSRRRIERDLVKLDSDAQTKQDKGRRVDARHRRATQALLDREDELVAGYAEMTYLGLVGVTASSEEELEHQCELVEQLARETGLDLRSLDGRQDLAWAAGLPLGLAPASLVL